MAKINLIATARRWFIGAFGNLSISPTFIAKLAAVPAGDVIVFGDKVEPNLKEAALTLALVDECTPLRVGLYCTHVLHAMHMYCLHVHSSCDGQR